MSTTNPTTENPAGTEPAPALVGWQIVHRETNDPPNDQHTYEIYPWDFVRDWLDRRADRHLWELLPIFEGDVENPVFADTREAVPDYQAFEERYTLVPNPNAASAGEPPASCTFETYGDELAFVKSQSPRCIWTITDGDNDRQYIVAGFRLANRIGYLITREQWTSEEETYGNFRADEEENFTDSLNVTLERERVELLALRNVMGSMGTSQLAAAYLTTLDDEELLNWATDEYNLFPPTTPWLFDEETNKYFRLATGILQIAPPDESGTRPDESQITEERSIYPTGDTSHQIFQQLYETNEQLLIRQVARLLTRELQDLIHHGSEGGGDAAEIKKRFNELCGADQELAAAMRQVLEETEGIKNLDEPFICNRCGRSFARRDRVLACDGPHPEETDARTRP